MSGRLRLNLGLNSLGLVVTLAPLAVIAVIVLLLFQSQLQTRETQVRAQGMALSRVLSALSLDQLVPGGGAQGPLELVNLSLGYTDFAYGVVTGRNGVTLTRVSAPGVVPPNLSPTDGLRSWSGQRNRSLGPDNTQVVEFFSPILRDGEVVANLRLGFIKPHYAFTPVQLPFFATLALPVFLLAPFFYFLLRREIRPLRKAKNEIGSLVHTGQLTDVTVEASGELREFIDGLNRFMQLARERVNELSASNAELETNQKVISYRKVWIQNVLDAMPEAVLVLDEEGKVTFSNAKVANLLGVEPDEIVGKLPREWCADADVREQLQAYETPERDVPFVDTMVFAPESAPEKRLATNAYPLLAGGSPVGKTSTLVVLRDVTKSLMAEESRTSFIAHVAHELKTPLNALALYSEALQGEDGKDESFRIEAMNVIQDQIERAADLVDNLLNITRIEMGSMKLDRNRVRLNDLLEDTFNHIRDSGRGKEVEISLNIPPELTAVAVDKDLMRIALNNLMVNAIKYTPAGGRVQLSATEDSSKIEIRVSDTGIGISAEEQARIFERFYRSSDEKVRDIGGHGLGLPLARDIIEMHHGRLEVQSEPGRGSIFSIKLFKDRGLVQQAI